MLRSSNWAVVQGPSRVTSPAWQTMWWHLISRKLPLHRAVTLWTGPATVDFRQANIMEYDLHAEGPWDLVVLSDIMCYLGWLYSFFDVSWFASQLLAATRVGGHCLFANAMGEFGDMLLLPWITRTYRECYCAM